MGRLVFVAVSGLLASLGAAAWPCPARAAELPVGSDIAYAHRGGIWSVGADGMGARALPLPRRDGAVTLSYDAPAWSPDGAALAVTELRSRGRTRTARVALTDAGGSRVRLLAGRSAGDAYQPAWSPDGSRIAFATSDGRRSAIVVADVATGRRTVVARAGLDGTSIFVGLGAPAWAPGGDRLAYTRYATGPRGRSTVALRVVGADGLGDRLLVPDGQAPAWSPDGSRIAFSSVRDHHGTHREGEDEDGYDAELYVMDSDGSHLVRLTDALGDEQRPSWSADGARIVYASDRTFPGAFGGDNAELHSVAPDGSCPSQLTNASSASGAPAWRPGSAGASAPCGVVPPPTVDLDTSRAGRTRGYTALWLGAQGGGLLVSGFQLDAHGAYFDYDDCGLPTPEGCGTPLQVSTDSVCHQDAQRGLEAYLAQAARVTRLRGALLATFSGDGGVAVLSGTGFTALHYEVGFDTPAAVQLRPALGDLRRYGEAAPAVLDPPVLPARLLRALRRVEHEQARTHDLAATARRLRLPRSFARSRLRLARALRRFGPVGEVTCP